MPALPSPKRLATDEPLARGETPTDHGGSLANAKLQMNKTKACKKAQAEITEIRRSGCGWIYLSHDPATDAWRESLPKNYWAAKRSRRVALIDRARSYLHPDSAGPCAMEPGDYVGGPWQSYVQ
jgi:hypothetical protein